MVDWYSQASIFNFLDCKLLKHLKSRLWNLYVRLIILNRLFGRGLDAFLHLVQNPLFVSCAHVRVRFRSMTAQRLFQRERLVAVLALKKSFRFAGVLRLFNLLRNGKWNKAASSFFLLNLANHWNIDFLALVVLSLGDSNSRKRANGLDLLDLWLTYWKLASKLNWLPLLNLLILQYGLCHLFLLV